MAPDAAAQAEILRLTGQMFPKPYEVRILPTLRIGLGILARLGRGQHLQRVGHAAVLPAGRVEHGRYAETMREMGRDTRVRHFLALEGRARRGGVGCDLDGP